MEYTLHWDGLGLYAGCMPVANILMFGNKKRQKYAYHVGVFHPFGICKPGEAIKIKDVYTDLDAAKAVAEAVVKQGLARLFNLLSTPYSLHAVGDSPPQDNRVAHVYDRR